MINWIIAFYYYLHSFGLLNIDVMLTQNLPIVLICRGIYIATYYFNYHKDYLKELTAGEKLFAKKEAYYFSLKQLFMILSGTLFTPIAVFIAFYSLMMSGQYLKSLGSKLDKKVIKILGIITYYISPIIGILYYTFLNLDYYSLAAVSFSVFAFLNYGLKNSKLSLAHLLEKYSRRKIEKIPKIASYILIFLILAFPTTLIIQTAVYNPQTPKTFMVPMVSSDKAKLATDVYFAPGSFGSPRPVILIRTPYIKSSWAVDLYLPYYTTQDYHVVIQDLRGTGDSEGGSKFLFFVNSYLDGVDTINWILNQSWCNGKIASAGISALCINEYFYAGMGPEGLYAQQLWFGTPELFDHAIFQGSYHKSSVEGWTKNTSPSNAQYQINTILSTIPKDEVRYNSTSLSIPMGPSYSNVSVHAIHVGGWYDLFLQGTLDGYVGYDDNGTSRAKGHQKLIMGPWTHGAIYGGPQGELIYPENSNGFNLILDWEHQVFDEALLGIPTDWNGAHVAYYLMGDVDTASDQWNYWRYAYDWPLDHEDDEWFFTSDGSLSKSTPGLTNERFSYLFDPRSPVPTLGGQNQPFDVMGPVDQSSIENRTDVLIFETPSLTEAVETVGRIWGHLYISSNCTDTDFTIKLTDVYPDGRSMLITDASLTARFRDNYTTETFMTGNQNDVYELLIDCCMR